jgi:LPXTG-motif cell wall-anchored protein
LVTPEGPAESADNTAILVAFFVGTYLTSFLLRGIAVVLILSGSSTAGFVLDSLSVVVFGPAFVAIVLTGVNAGKVGVRRLLVDLLPRRSGWSWYVLAFLIPIAASYIAMVVNIITFGAPFPNSWFPASWLFLLGFLVFQLLFLTPGEEIGWRGFALPRLQERLGSLGGTFLLAALWLGWQAPLFFMIGTTQVGRSLIVYALALLAWSLIMTWLYNSSGGSILTAVLFHTSVNVVGYTLPFDAGLTVLLVLILLGCGAILLYPRPLLQTSGGTQGSATGVGTADIEVTDVEAADVEVTGPATIDAQVSHEKTKRERREKPEERAIETLGRSGRTPDTYGGSGGTVKEGEETREGLTGALGDAFRNARRGRLPDTGGGLAVLLLIGVALIGGGWILVRRVSSSG